MLRLLGENPFLLVLPLARPSGGAWQESLFVWAASLSAFAVIATVVWPLRAFGPGRNYMKSAIFPTAYVLAAAIGTPSGLLTPPGLATLAALGASMVSVIFFLGYMRGKQAELTAHVPPGLRARGRASRVAPGGRCRVPARRLQRLRDLPDGTARPVGFPQRFAREVRTRVAGLARARGGRGAETRSALSHRRARVRRSAGLALDAGCAQAAQEDGFDLFDLQAAPAG